MKLTKFQTKSSAQPLKLIKNDGNKLRLYQNVLKYHELKIA